MTAKGTRREVGPPVLTARQELDQLVEKIEWERRNLRFENALLKESIRRMDEQRAMPKAVAAGAK